jgi:hypothetical protein
MNMRESAEHSTKAHWKQKNFIISTAVDRPTGTLSRLRYAACMGWPPVELGVM